MQYIPDGTEIVLWGLGEVGKRILAGEFGNYKISFAVDRKWMQRRIELDKMENTENIAVYFPDVLDEMPLDDKVLVLSTYKWKEIADNLEKKGKRIFRDYMPYSYLRSGPVLDVGFLWFFENDSDRKALLKKYSLGKSCAPCTVAAI